ncbi:MAG: ribosome-associated translation inhibitor RaiA [Paraglaciecola sp.]|jgi:ribosome-associated translation inhibitor RaiA
MQLIIHSENMDISDQLKDDIIQKARSILTNTGKQIRKIKIRFCDKKSPQGGLNKQCKVQLVLFGLPSVFVVAHKKNIQYALVKALQNASKILKGSFIKSHKPNIKNVVL